MIRKLKHILLLGLLSILSQSCASPGDKGTDVILVEELEPYVERVLEEFNMISDERKETLNSISELISDQLHSGDYAKLSFICTHNSRRSHMSQVWSQTAAYYYGVDNVFSFSGGTEETACNIRTVHALERAGFVVDHTSEGENPVYLITYSLDRQPVKAFSKLYSDDENPQEEFIALMCCSKADRSCPVVKGASSRFAIHYEDPAECDGTDDEEEVYDARCLEISREMFFIMSRVESGIEI